MMNFSRLAIFGIAALFLQSCRADKPNETAVPNTAPVVSELAQTPLVSAIVMPAEADILAARAASKSLGRQLKTKLMGAMQEGGPAAAINICAIEAPKIAHALSEQTGYTVGRTALRLRSRANAPDMWEQTQMLNFAAALGSGQNPQSLEASAIVLQDGARVFRWSKPIVLNGPCATCHGVAVSDEIKAMIALRYPGDQATGFAMGELRGAFTVSRVLEDH